MLTDFALGDTDASAANVQQSCQQAPDHIASSVVVATSRSTTRELIDQYTRLDIVEIIFFPNTDNLDEVSRLVDAIGTDSLSAALHTDTI